MLQGMLRPPPYRCSRGHPSHYLRFIIAETSLNSGVGRGPQPRVFLVQAVQGAFAALAAGSSKGGEKHLEPWRVFGRKETGAGSQNKKPRSTPRISVPHASRAVEHPRSSLVEPLRISGPTGGGPEGSGSGFGVSPGLSRRAADVYNQRRRCSLIEPPRCAREGQSRRLVIYIESRGPPEGNPTNNGGGMTIYVGLSVSTLRLKPAIYPSFRRGCPLTRHLWAVS